MNAFSCSALVALASVVTTTAQFCFSPAGPASPVDESDVHVATHQHLRRLRNEAAERGVDPRVFCHQYTHRCPVNEALVERLDKGDFDDLNVTYQFPTIPSAMLDHCTTIANRGERVKCVDGEVTNFAIRMQTPMIDELLQMPHEWYQDYLNYSTMPRLIVKQVTNADVVWRTCLKPNVLEVHAEQTFPVGW